MSAVEDVDRLIERFHQAQGEFVKGDPEPTKELFSQKDDVTLASLGDKSNMEQPHGRKKLEI